MDSTTFYRRFVASLRPGTMLQNPGGGTTEIIDYAANDRLVYQRSSTRIKVRSSLFISSHLAVWMQEFVLG
jgi:hypothetical protein